MADERPRRPASAIETAEAVFKPRAPTVSELKPAKKVIPKAKEMVSLRIDQDVLAFFQEQGIGWQDRLNDTLRKAIALD